MRDTTPVAAAIQADVQRRLSGAQRLTTALEMSILVRELAAARLRRDHPELSDEEIQRELLRYAFGRETLPVPLR
jgi:hypothetical protein